MQQSKETKTLIAVTTLVIAGFLLINLIVDATALPDWAPLLTLALFILSFGFWAWMWVDDRRQERLDFTQGADTGSQFSLPQAQEWIIPTKVNDAPSVAIPAKTEATDEAAAEVATPHEYRETDEKIEEAMEDYVSEEGSVARAVMDQGPSPTEIEQEVIEVDAEHYEDSVLQADVAEETLVKELPVEETTVTGEPPSVAEETAVDEGDNLTVIEGIGPHYRDLLAGEGITTFAQLSAMDETSLREALLKAGASRIPKSVETWSEQAGYALKGDWDGLAVFQSTLDAGRRR